MASPNPLEKLRELIAQEQKVKELLEAWFESPHYGTPNGTNSAESRLYSHMSCEFHKAKEEFQHLAMRYDYARIVDKNATLIEQLKYREFRGEDPKGYPVTLHTILPKLVEKVESLEKEVTYEKEERQKVENECMKKMEVLMAEVNSLKAELHQLKTEPQTFFQKLRSLF